MVLGIIGGVFAVLVGLLLYTGAQLLGEVGVRGLGGIKALCIIVPIIGLVGGAIVKTQTAVGSVLMLLAAVLGVVLIGFNVFSLLPGIFLFLGGLLGLFGLQEQS
jgi:hypothetical protein